MLKTKFYKIHYNRTSGIANDVDCNGSAVVDELKNLDLSIPSFSLPPVKPVLELITKNDSDLEGSKKFSTAFDALEAHYKTKVVIIAEKLKKHEEGRPKFLTKDLKERLLLVKAVYPLDHPNYQV